MSAPWHFAAPPARWLIVSVFVVCALLRASPAAAATTIAASGGFLQTGFDQSNIRTVGGVTQFDFTEHDTLSGTLTGTSVIQGSCVVRTSGAAVCQAVETFTGTVAGQTGSLVFRDVVELGSTGTAQGSFTVISGGSLATIHGHGSFEGVGTSGTYSAQLVVAP
jgi:hypothetical protein